jgi:hypothetical protein
VPGTGPDEGCAAEAEGQGAGRDWQRLRGKSSRRSAPIMIYRNASVAAGIGARTTARFGIQPARSCSEGDLVKVGGDYIIARCIAEVERLFSTVI